MNHINLFPEEILKNIFSFCDHQTQKTVIPQVCHLWDEIQEIKKIQFLDEKKIVKLSRDEYETLKKTSNYFKSLENFYAKKTTQIELKEITSQQFVDYALNLVKEINKDNIIEALNFSYYFQNDSLKEICELFISNYIKQAYNQSMVTDLINSLKELNVPFKLNLQEYAVDKTLELFKGLALESLNLKGCGQITDRGLEFLREIPFLKSLNLTNCCQITDHGLELLTKMSLKSLNLSFCHKITNEGLKHLQQMPLQVLNLDSCIQISAGLEFLKKLPLQFLDISDCNKIRSTDFEHLKELPLKFLNLGWCKIQGTRLKKINFHDLCEEYDLIAINKIMETKNIIVFHILQKITMSLTSHLLGQKTDLVVEQDQISHLDNRSTLFFQIIMTLVKEKLEKLTNPDKMFELLSEIAKDKNISKKIQEKIALPYVKQLMIELDENLKSSIIDDLVNNKIALPVEFN